MNKYGLKALKKSLSAEELNAHKQAYWGSKLSVFTFSRFMAGRYAATMYPLIELFYKDKSKEELGEALLRQNEFWNGEATMHNLAVGILASMEKDHAETGETPIGAINGIKMALIGPFSAIGDTVFWVLWRVIVTGIALSFSLQGSIIGPIFFIVAYNAPKFYLTWYFQLLGYNLGKNLVSTMGESGLMQQLTRACYVLGSFMMGAMIPMLVSVPLKLTFSMNKLSVSLIEIFDGVLRGSLELLAVFIMVKLIRKKINPIIIVLGTFVACILGAYFGVF